MNRIVLFSVAILFCSCLFGRAEGLNILLSNDDGFESANLRALYLRLKDAGHDVLVCGPVHQQSGRGGAVDGLKPIGALEEASRYGTVPVGAPGVGVDPTNADIHYVSGTPVMALLYGAQILAADRWKAFPDLVIAGPNEGNNLGAIVVVSGTANIAFTALSLGIPSIAVSWRSSSRSFLKLKEEDPAFEVADWVVGLVRALQRGAQGKKRLLPPNLGLNVNFPKFEPGEGDQLEFRFSRVGGHALPTLSMFRKLSASSYAASKDEKSDLPGISVLIGSQSEPDGLAIPIDSTPDSESMLSRLGVITISPIRMTPEGTEEDARVLKRRLNGLTRIK